MGRAAGDELPLVKRAPVYTGGAAILFTVQLESPAVAITIKRVYDEPESRDGMRILVDRLWPRGLSKEKAAVDLWIKEIAPSGTLRHWYGHDPDKWPEFKKRYFAELDKNRQPVEELLGQIKSRITVFLFSAKEARYNNAAALKEYIEPLL